jgi:hypothetical protein
MHRWFLAALFLEMMLFTGSIKSALNAGAGAPTDDGRVSASDGNSLPPPPK